MPDPANNPPNPVPPSRKGAKAPPTPRKQMLESQRLLQADIRKPRTGAALRVELIRAWIALQGEIRALSPRGPLRKASQDASSPGKASAFVPPVETSDNVPPIEPDNPEVT